MNRNFLFSRLAYLILFIFFVNLVAVKLYWYSLIWYFDMPMHFLGGFWLGLLMLWLLRVSSLSPRVIWLTLAGVLLIGIGWEVFELVVDSSTGGGAFNVLDTLSDICFDTAGGFTALLFYFRKYGSIAII